MIQIGLDIIWKYNQKKREKEKFLIEKRDL